MAIILGNIFFISDNGCRSPYIVKGDGYRRLEDQNI